MPSLVRNDPCLVLRDHLANDGTAWSIGVQGAMAEYLHTDEPARTIDDWTVVSSLGGIRIIPADGIVLRAYEELSAHGASWTHGVAVCLPERQETSAPNTRITELGADKDAIKVEDRRAVLFDLGIGSPACRFCVRLRDAARVQAMRQFAGRTVFDADIIQAVLRWNPDRVMISRCGRIEVYQPIATEKTPEGPHTHFIPKLFRPAMVTSANVPLPRGYTACLIMYPENPVRDRLGRIRRFSQTHHDAFQALLDAFGDPDYLHAKRSAEQARPLTADNRLARLAQKIANRQAHAREQTTVHA